MSDRRSFLKGAAASAAALVAPQSVGQAEAAFPATPPAVLPPSDATTLVEMGLAPAQAPVQAAVVSASASTYGSDFAVEVLRSLQLDYVAQNPGSTFKGLHESIINYGQNSKPELLTCLHEEIASAMSHGYAKAAGKPMAILLHGTVGLLHAAYGIFQCWCDRVPMIVLVGQGTPSRQRDRPPSQRAGYGCIGERLYEVGRRPDHASEFRRFSTDGL